MLGLQTRTTMDGSVVPVHEGELGDFCPSLAFVCNVCYELGYMKYVVQVHSESWPCRIIV